MIKTGQKIHTRKIDIATYEGASDSIIIEGILRDERLLNSYRPNGEIYPPGTIHHLIIRMEVKGPQLVIEDIEVEMPTVPHEACVETLESLAPVKGMPIVSGFTAKVKDLVGGTKGCCHLFALLTAMAPAVVQGAWSAMAREPIDPEIYMPMALGRVKNTCWVWREDGPLMKEWSARV
ncbi:MAG: DUF2889 domain-containing protein [Desulfosarcina sp.]|nr:DUF2889 domain-containing protein [Desulfosarcina sp.]